MATDHATSVANLLQCFDDLQALTGELAGDQWNVQSLCPDWTVHGVVAHLAGIEHVLTGWFPSAGDEPPPFGGIGPFMDEAAGLTGAELTERLGGLLDGRRAELSAMTPEQLDSPSMTPVRPGTYGRFMAVRVFDFWVHQRDMTIPLGIATDDGGSHAEQALEEVHMSLGYIVGKKIGMEDGQSIAFHLTGPIETDLYAAVDGRAGVVDSVDNPTTEITTDSTTFIMLACGRIDPAEQIAAGKISWTGDAEWGERAATSLRFTM